ncbi:MAG: hypothetical protein QG673_1759 [Pseudomonadota bacterium]|nr:hypothetical protein [Pseudomonadota bacterium]
MASIMLDDLSINYHDNNNLDKPTLIFIHGLGENLQSWKYQLDEFDKDYHIIAMDLRGHGLSGDGISEITLERLASDVIYLLEFLKIRRAHFIGLSMGGIICQELTKRYQHRMLSLTLCSTTSFFPNTSPYVLNERLNFIKNTPMEVMAEYAARMCLPPHYDKKLYEQALTMFRQNRHVPYLAATAAVFSIDLRPILGQINVTTLIVVGELDIITPVKSSQYLHEHICDSKLVIMPGVGHLTRLENPSLFNQILREFLSATATAVCPN